MGLFSITTEQPSQICARKLKNRATPLTALDRELVVPDKVASFTQPWSHLAKKGAGQFIPGQFFL